MPTPNHPMLPLCSAFAADPARYLFANWLETMLMDQPQETLQDDARRLKGMLIAYLELDLVNCKQYKALADELNTFAFGAAA